MLRLARPTPDGWAAALVPHLDEVLLDHAHCEKKAASTAINLIFRYQDRAPLMRPLSELAREELEHFEQVMDLLADRGVPFRPLEPSPYASRLYTAVRKAEPHRLLDTLLCCALIEARSCERMKALAQVLQGPLHELYDGLLASEARHHATYVDLALQFFERDQVFARLAELAAHEADVIEAAPREARLHSRAP